MRRTHLASPWRIRDDLECIWRNTAEMQTSTLYARMHGSKCRPSAPRYTKPSSRESPSAPLKHSSSRHRARMHTMNCRNCGDTSGGKRDNRDRNQGDRCDAADGIRPWVRPLHVLLVVLPHEQMPTALGARTRSLVHDDPLQNSFALTCAAGRASDDVRKPRTHPTYP